MKIPARRADQCIIGVAIALPEPQAAQVRAVRAAVGDPLAQIVPPHITLLPPTSVDIENLEAITTHLQEVAARRVPFTINLEQVGTFRPVSPVVFLKLKGGGEECTELQAAVREQNGPLALPLNFPYHPHVTLAHDLSDAALDRAACSAAEMSLTFSATGIRLYRFTSGSRWEIMATHTFGAS